MNEIVLWIVGVVLVVLVVVLLIDKFVVAIPIVRKYPRATKLLVGVLSLGFAFVLGSRRKEPEESAETHIEPDKIDDSEQRKTDAEADDTDLEAHSTDRSLDDLADDAAERDDDLDELRTRLEEL